MRFPAAIAVLATLAVGLAGCGDGEGGSEGADLAAMLPADPPGPIVFADFAAGRDAAGLPDDADLKLAAAEGGAEGRRFAQGAGAALPLLVDPRNALAEALDAGAVQAAASNPIVTLVETDQEFEEVATALEEAGGPIAVEGDDGLIGIGSDRAVVELALAGERGGEGLERTLAEELGSVPVGGVIVAERSRSCLSGVAIGDEIEGGAGELLLSVEPSADPASFLLAKAPGVEGLSPYAAFAFEEPEADGELLRVRFTYPVEEEGAPIALVQAATLPDQSFYACAGAGAD